MDALTLSLAKTNLAATPKAQTANGDFDAAARNFEAVFLGQMLEQMWSAVPTDGPMGGGTGEQIFRSLMIQDVGRQMANQGGIGLAANVKHALLAMQEAR